MLIAYQIALAIGVIVAVVFTVLVLLTGKGDAMSGGGSVRTTFKGKASFDDQISRMTLGLGIAFMALMLGVDILSKATSRIADSRVPEVSQPAAETSAPMTVPVTPPATTTPAPTDIPKTGN